MWIADKWKEYSIIDTSEGEKLEMWGKYSLVRPDPQVIWKTEKKHRLWTHADASYKRSRSGGGAWNENRLPESWNISYKDLTFLIKPTGFKHTGLFPEQAVNWDFTAEKIRKAKAEGRDEVSFILHTSDLFGLWFTPYYQQTVQLRHSLRRKLDIVDTRL